MPASRPVRSPVPEPPVPFLDVGASYRELRSDLDEAIAGVLDRGWFVLGPEVAAFESAFAAHVQAAHAVGTGNGLDALTLALRAVGVGPGDEVIVPSHTFVATWLAVSAIGAVPVPVDPDPDTALLAPDAAEAAVGPRTRAIVPVHLYGRPADVPAFVAVARRHGLAVVEDAAQAHGARVGTRRIGAHGDAACWSFYPGKNLGAFGDGGAVTTDDPGVAARVRRLANYGSEEKYHHDVLGVNSRLDELQAAVLRVKLAHLDAWNDRRRAVAEAYHTALADLEGLTLPPTDPTRGTVWHLFVVRTDERDRLRADLHAAGVDAMVHYPVPCHRQPAYAATSAAQAHLPVADDLARTVLSLPMGPHLRPDQVGQVVEAVRRSPAATR